MWLVGRLVSGVMDIEVEKCVLGVAPVFAFWLCCLPIIGRPPDPIPLRRCCFGHPLHFFALRKTALYVFL